MMTPLQALSAPFDFAKAERFQKSLPANLAIWAPQVLAASKVHNVSPWFVVGVLQRESLGGHALTPKGPSGTGDQLPRRPGNKYAPLANPKTGLPPDGLGWGRGLMQIDYGVHTNWVTTHNWRDPLTNIDFGTSLLAGNLQQFSRNRGQDLVVESWRWTRGMPSYGIRPWVEKYPGVAVQLSVKDPRPLTGEALHAAAIAAFNAGSSGVLQAVGAGLPAEAVTSSQDYVTYFLRSISTWVKRFSEDPEV